MVTYGECERTQHAAGDVEAGLAVRDGVLNEAEHGLAAGDERGDGLAVPRSGATGDFVLKLPLALRLGVEECAGEVTGLIQLREWYVEPERCSGVAWQSCHGG